MADLRQWKRFQTSTKYRIDVSQQKQLSITQSTIHSNLKKVGLKYYKHQKTSKYNKNQFEQIAKKVSTNEMLNCKIKYLSYC